MKSLRTTLCLLIGLLLAALSLPSDAAATQKLFTINMIPQTPTSTTGLQATFWNLSSGNSTIKSMTLTVPTLPDGSHPFLIAAAPVPSGFTGTITSACTNSAWPCATVLVNYMSGINTSGSGPVSGSLTFNLTTLPNVGCAQYTWTAQAFTGNNFGPTAFTYVGPDKSTYAQPYTSFTTTCALKFAPAPSNTQINTPIAVGVEVVDTGNNDTVAQWFTGPATLTGAGPGAVTITGPTYSSNTPYIASFSVSASALGTYTVTANALNLASLTGTFTVYDGTLACQPTTPFQFGDLTAADSVNAGYASGYRGYWNKGGITPCQPLLYTFTNSILTPDPITGQDNTVHLAWDTTTGQYPAFSYTMTWKTEDVANASNPSGNTDASTYGWPVPKRPYVAWQTSDGTASGTPLYVPALTCMSTDLPAPYGALDSTTPITTTTQTSFTIDVPPPGVPTGYPTATLPPPGDSTATPPTLAPFPIVIGTERMKVTVVTAGPGSGQYTLTVVRGDGLTPSALHSSGAYVMSTPLPIEQDSSTGYGGQQVPMCVVNHGWMAAGIDPANGIPQVRYFTTVYDIGDGFVTIR